MCLACACPKLNVQPEHIRILETRAECAHACLPLRACVTSEQVATGTSGNGVEFGFGFGFVMWCLCLSEDEVHACQDHGSAANTFCISLRSSWKCSANVQCLHSTIIPNPKHPTKTIPSEQNTTAMRDNDRNKICMKNAYIHRHHKSHSQRRCFITSSSLHDNSNCDPIFISKQNRVLLFNHVLSEYVMANHRCQHRLDRYLLDLPARLSIQTPDILPLSKNRTSFFWGAAQMLLL